MLETILWIFVGIPLLLLTFTGVVIIIFGTIQWLITNPLITLGIVITCLILFSGCGPAVKNCTIYKISSSEGINAWVKEKSCPKHIGIVLCKDDNIKCQTRVVIEKNQQPAFKWSNFR